MTTKASQPVSDTESGTRDVWLRLEPEDVLLFRDGRPFNAGQDFRAEGIFPPHPAPVVGAIRAALLSPLLTRRGKTFHDLPGERDLTDLYGGDDDLGALRFAGPLVCRFVPDSGNAALPLDSELALPLPADLLGNSVPRPDDKPAPGRRSALPGVPDLPLSRTLVRGRKRDGAWLTETEIISYLTGQTELPVPPKNPFTPEYAENRIGIEIGAGRTVEEGRFYNIQFRRPHWDSARATGLLVRVTLPVGADLPDGYVTAGGESRCLYLRKVSGLSEAFQGARARVGEAIAADGGRFKLLLATPGIFRGGLIPELLQSGGLPDLPLRLVAAASGKPVVVSGWNVRSNAPRPLRRAAPAGTVYHVQLENPGQVDQLLDRFHLTTALQDEDPFRAAQGFGLTLVGAWARDNRDVKGS